MHMDKNDLFLRMYKGALSFIMCTQNAIPICEIASFINEQAAVGLVKPANNIGSLNDVTITL